MQTAWLGRWVCCQDSSAWRISAELILVPYLCGINNAVFAAILIGYVAVGR